MSESQLPGSTTPVGSSPAEGKTRAAAHEAQAVAGAAADDAGRVAATAKDEAVAVAKEAKAQVRDLYSQTQQELKEQAAAQQERVAGGLRSLGDELGAMASSSSSSGVASDLVQQVSTRLTGAAEWLGDRDPGSLVREVKNYARRNPGTFIAAAAIVGVAAGRLTRALASNAHEESGPTESAASTTPSASPDAHSVSTSAPIGAVPPPPPMPDTPVYTEAAADAQRRGGR